MKKKHFLLGVAFVILALVLACSVLATPTPPQSSNPNDSMLQTQMAINVQQTVLAMEIAQLTQGAPPPAGEQSGPGANLPGNNPPASNPSANNPPQPNPVPDTPLFTAGENMYCRGGPAPAFIDHWMLDKDKTYNVLGKWYTNEWLLVGIDNPDTRTKCCWVGGKGDLNVNLASLPEIDYLPDRMSCQPPNPDVVVWDFNLGDTHFLSCEQVTQSEWYICGGADDYCTDANYDSGPDYQVSAADVFTNCPGIRFP